MSDLSGSGAYNQSAAHDTALYDPNVHDNQIVAMYDSDAGARQAMQVLVSQGFPASAMHVVARPGDTTDATAAEEGLWGAIKSLFVPDEERSTYNHAITRGHAMLVVTPEGTTDRSRLIHALEATHPLDFDAKLEEWRQAGYENIAAVPEKTGGMNTLAAAGMAGTAVGMDQLPKSTGPAASHASPTPAPTVAPTAAHAAAPAPKPVTASQPSSAATGNDTDTIKVMEERLRIGKREVAAGAVRIRSYIVERPVEEQVRLHEERIHVERHPVDRAATAADTAAFQERTIEARATSEEAVISKEARVVEEIGIKKEASDRVETVRDTVRETKVEIEGDTKGTLAGKTGPTGAPNATPGVTNSGMNAPRK